MFQSRSTSAIAGPILAMAAGALALAQIVFWGIWNFDTPPSGPLAVTLYGAAPGIGAVATLALGARLLHNAHPESAGRRTALWLAAGPLVLAFVAFVVAQLGIAY